MIVFICVNTLCFHITLFSLWSSLNVHIRRRRTVIILILIYGSFGRHIGLCQVCLPKYYLVVFFDIELLMLPCCDRFQIILCSHLRDWH